MNKAKYESIRPLIVLLGLTELAWLSYWLLRHPLDSNFIAVVAGWVLVMLVWLVWVIRAGKNGLYLKYTRWLSNLIGVNLVFAFGVVWFRLMPSAW